MSLPVIRDLAVFFPFHFTNKQVRSTGRSYQTAFLAAKEINQTAQGVS